MICPSKKCLENETIDSYSKTVTGILIVTGALAVMVLICGVWVITTNGVNGNQPVGTVIPFVPEMSSSEKSILEDQISEDMDSDLKVYDLNPSEALVMSGTGDVLVTERCELGFMDTEPGFLAVCDANLPCDPLPLCITNDYLSQFSLTVCSYGGYEPLNGWVRLFQQKTTGAFEGQIDMTWTDMGQDICPITGCIVDVYLATFTVAAPIMLDSNHPPAGICGDADLCFIPEWAPDELGKKVYVVLQTDWTGCGEPDQKFRVIPAHKSLSRNPELSMRDISPVLM